MAHTLAFLEHTNTEALFGCTDCDRVVVLKVGDGSVVTLAEGAEVDHGAQDLMAVWDGMNTGQKNRRSNPAELKQLDNNPLWQSRKRP